MMHGNRRVGRRAWMFAVAMTAGLLATVPAARRRRLERRRSPMATL